MSTYTYQVQRSVDGSAWTDVSGASGSFDGISPFTHDISYLIQSADAGDYLRCKVTDAAGNVTYSGMVGPATTTVPTSYRPYVSTSAFNIPIPANPPIHPGSTNMISAGNNWLLGGSSPSREWLGPSDRTAYDRGDTSALSQIQMYANNNGWAGAGPFTIGMPSWMAAEITPDCQTGDSYVVLVDSRTGDVWEMWHTTPPGQLPRNPGFSSSRWNCSALRHWPAATIKSKGYGTVYPTFQPGTSGSKIQLAAGMLVPEDFSDCFSGSDPGTAIPHMMRLNSYCGSNGDHYPVSVAPAELGDGRQPYGIPAGARVQLDPSINVATWASVNAKSEPWRSGLKKLLRGLQVYGITQVDSFGAPGFGDIDCVGPGSVAHGGTTYAAGYKFPWDQAGYGWFHNIGGNGIPYDLMPHFRVIDWTRWAGV